MNDNDKPDNHETDRGLPADIATDDALVEPARTLTWPLAILFMITAAIVGGSAVYVWQQRSASPNATDIGFADDMSAHHNQAVRMSIAYLTNGRDRFLRHMAEEVLVYQIGEVRDMQAALADWDESGDDDDAMAWMGMAVDENQQPGMATPDELEQLDTATGDAIDELFSRLMIRHHAGGAHMAEYQVDHGNVEAMRELAQIMLNGQASEVVELNRWRADNGYDLVTTSDLPS